MQWDPALHASTHLKGQQKGALGGFNPIASHVFKEYLFKSNKNKTHAQPITSPYFCHCYYHLDLRSLNQPCVLTLPRGAVPLASPTCLGGDFYFDALAPWRINPIPIGGTGSENDL